MFYASFHFWIHIKPWWMKRWGAPPSNFQKLSWELEAQSLTSGEWGHFDGKWCDGPDVTTGGSILCSQFTSQSENGSTWMNPGCPRRPINPVIWLIVLYLSYIWVKKEFVLYNWAKMCYKPYESWWPYEFTHMATVTCLMTWKLQKWLTWRLDLLGHEQNVL